MFPNMLKTLLSHLKTRLFENFTLTHTLSSGFSLCLLFNLSSFRAILWILWDGVLVEVRFLRNDFSQVFFISIHIMQKSTEHHKYMRKIYFPYTKSWTYLHTICYSLNIEIIGDFRCVWQNATFQCILANAATND